MILTEGKLELRAEVWIENDEWKVLLRGPLWLMDELDRQMREVATQEGTFSNLYHAAGPSITSGGGTGQASYLEFTTRYKVKRDS